MNGEKFMTAIYGISDKYVAECANEKHLYTRKKIRARVLIAASVALVVLSVIFAANSFYEKQKYIIWNQNADIQEIERYYDQATAGNIVITESLENAVAVLTPSAQDKPTETDEKSVFAILITETTDTILSSNSKSLPVCVFINNERALFFCSVSSTISATPSPMIDE